MYSSRRSAIFYNICRTFINNHSVFILFWLKFFSIPIFCACINNSWYFVSIFYQFICVHPYHNSVYRFDIVFLLTSLLFCSLHIWYTVYTLFVGYVWKINPKLPFQGVYWKFSYYFNVCITIFQRKVCHFY